MKVLYVLFLLDSLNLAVYLPVFSAFVRSLGGTPFTLGLINSSSALISLVWNPIVGSLSDQNGRKGLLSKCMLASAIGSIILCISSSSLLLVFVGKLIGALGSPVAILLRSTVADTFKTDDEKKLFLNKSAPLISLAFLVGSLASGFLSEAKNGYSLAFLLMATTMGLAAVLAARKLPSDNKSKTQIKDTSSFVKKATQELKTAVVNIRSISWPRYKYNFYMKGFYDFSMAMLFSNVGLILLQEFNIKGRAIGFVFLLIGISRIASTLLKLKLKNYLSQISDHRKVFVGALTLIVTNLGMMVSTSFYTFLFFLITLCMVRFFMDTTFAEIIATRTTESDRGKVMAAYDNLLPFSLFVAPLISGIVAEAFGQRILIGFAAVQISITALVAYQQRNKTKSRTK